MTVSEAVKQRRTVRAFENRPVDREVLLRICNDARLYACSANLQPIRVGRTKGNPRLCRGNKKALAESKEIKKNPSIEQKWFADHTSTIERDSN